MYTYNYMSNYTFIDIILGYTYKYMSIICNKYNYTKVYIQVYE